MKNKTIDSGKYKVSELTSKNEDEIFIIEKDAIVEIIDDQLTKTNYQFDVLENADLTFLAIDKISDHELKVNRVFNVSANAKVNCQVLNLVQNKQFQNILINLDEENARGEINLVTIAKNKTDSLFDVRINNNAPRTFANIWQKGVVANGGKSKFLATGFIKKGADQAENFQESRVLLLDEAAVGDASPILLIDHYDVAAGHAASVSRVNEDELYYLMSRGINEFTSETLVILGFIRPFFDRLKDREMAEALYDEIQIEINRVHNA